MHQRSSFLVCLAFGAIVACGKGDNVHDVPLREYVHAYPEAPRDLTVNRTWAWANGRALGLVPASSPHAGALLAADRDNVALVRIARADLAPEATLPLGGAPEQLVILADGTVFVTLRPLGAVARVTPQLTLADVRVVGRETFGIAASADGERLYVTLPMESALVTLDRGLDELGRIATLPLPRGVAVLPSGDVVVAHQSDDALRFAVGDDGAALDLDVVRVPLRRQNPPDLVNGINTPRARGLNVTGGRALTVHPETGVPLIAHALAFTGTVFDITGAIVAAPSALPAYYSDETSSGSAVVAPAIPIEVTVSGTINETELHVTDPETGVPLAQLVDQPSDILHHPTRSLLFVTGLGTDNVLVLSTAEGDPMRSPLALIDVGHAPSAIVVSEDGATAYVLNSHELSVSEIDLRPLLTLAPSPLYGARETYDMFFASTDTPPALGGVAFPWDRTPESPRVAPMRMDEARRRTFAADPLSPELRRGLRLFTFTHNADVSRGGTFACASCHIDGGDDRLVWLTGDGPRQTPALAGRLEGTAPFSWNGTGTGLQANMQATVERMGGGGLSSDDLATLEHFLLARLAPPVNPFVERDGLTPLQAWGRDLFNSPEVGCASCHRPEQHFNDGLAHDVGTAGMLDRERFERERISGAGEPRPAGLFNTPTLEGLYYTAPYLHDGSAPTLVDVLERTGTTMGKTSHLTPEQRGALIAYLQTL